MTPSAQHLSRNCCIICRGPLTVHEAARNGVCDRSRCRQEFLFRWVDRRRQEAEAVLLRKVLEHRDEVARSSGVRDSEALPAVMVPASLRPTVQLPHRRKRWFRAGLAKLLAEIKTQRLGAAIGRLPKEETTPAKQFDDEPPYVRAGCTACRGHCCRLGGTKAFLDTVTLQRYIEAHPQLSFRDVLRAYMSKLPKKSARGSCVFHGEKGCTLPRAMRAAICNTYQCNELKELQKLSTNRVLIVAAGEGAVVRSALFNGDRHDVDSKHLLADKL